MFRVNPLRRPGRRGVLAVLTIAAFLVSGTSVRADSALSLELAELANVAVEFVRQIFGEGSLAMLFGLNVDLPPGEGEEKRDQRIRESLNHPTTPRTGTRIAAGPNSPYAIEVLIESPKGSKNYVP